MSCVIAYCRPGFEKELASELSELAGRIQLSGFAQAKEGSGFVLFQPQQESRSTDPSAHDRDG